MKAEFETMRGPAELRPVVKVFLAAGNQKAFWGPGVVNLLEGIEQTGSVRGASERMGMSYSKAWKLIRNIESQLAFAVVSRQQGGKQGGEAHLTTKGKAFLEKYILFERECNAAAAEIFARYY